MDIGSKIRDLRIQNNLTQDELAQKLSVTSQAVSRWESGSGMPDISVIVTISRVLSVSTDMLFGMEGEGNDALVFTQITICIR